MSANNYLRLSRDKENLFILEDCDADTQVCYKVGQAVGLLAVLKKASDYMRDEIVEYGLHPDKSIFRDIE